jgi:CBS domain-containing protein
MDIAAFLREYPPFDGLDEDAVSRAAARVAIEFFAEGSLILEQAQQPSHSMYVVRTGAVELLSEGRVLDVLGPGELFGHPSLVSGQPPAFSVRAREDTLCYLLDEETATAVLATPPGLRFLSRSLRARSARALEGHSAERADPWRAEVGSLVKRKAVMCTPTESIRRVAQTMAKERISSVLVNGIGTGIGTGLGIVTDRDLRSRVVAEGRSSDVPVSEIMSSPAISIGERDLVAEALQRMLEHGVHHLVVERADGTLSGVVTATDLMGLERTTPFTMRSTIERAADVESLIVAGRQIPDMVRALVDAAVDPVDVGHVVGVTIDALTVRMIELQIERLGEPPVPWAWLALGSQARHEQALATDQDHALAYDPQDRDPEEVDRWFADLAEAVVAGVEASGIPRCKAGVSASEPSWRRSVDAWTETFRGWMTDQSAEGSMLTAIAFDFRRIAGPLPFDERLREIVAASPSLPIFLKHLARNAAATRPPTGFLHDFVVEAKGEHVGTLDAKHGGITLVTGIARTFALAVGSTKIRTQERLRDAAAAGRIDEEDRAGLEEAFRLLWQIRLEHQTEAVRAGARPDDFVDPKRLGPITRQGLKSAFRLIDSVQRGMAVEFGVATR